MTPDSLDPPARGAPNVTQRIASYITDQQISREALTDGATIAQVEKATRASRAEILGVANLGQGVASAPPSEGTSSLSGK